MAVDRRTLWFAGALIVMMAVVALIWASGGSTSPTTPTSPTISTAAPRAPAARSRATDAEDHAPGKVNLEALQAKRGQPVDLGRNPFRFRPPPRPAPPPASAPRPLNQGGSSPTTPAVPTGPPPPPPIPLKFIGFATRGDGTKIAVLSDGRSAPQGGKEGDIILGQYRILRIGNESIEMAYVDGRGRQTIRLTGQ